MNAPTTGTSTPRFALLWPVALTLIIPLVAAWFAYPESRLPPGFGVFPPVQVEPAPGFNALYFGIIAVLALVVTALLIMPKWFGIKGETPLPDSERQPLPWWFWLGLALMVFFWWLMWARVTPFGDLVYFAFSPMWWGFIIMLDGIVYYRNNGNSLLKTRPGLFWFSAAISVIGWGYFEFYDYFVLENWYYPNGDMTALPHGLIVALFLIAYTTVWPAIFEWFSLLNTFPKLVARYKNGPKIPLNGTWLMVIGFVILFAMVFFPRLMFWGIWIGPMIVLVGMLMRLHIWTPFTALSAGNWSPAILIALSSLFNGFLWEMWNYGSAHPDIGYPTNPNYWIYDIPFVNVLHFFSEMPLLGYYGYLPFGALVWVFFIWIGTLFNRDTNLYCLANNEPVKPSADSTRFASR